MSRSKQITKRIIPADPIYSSRLVTHLINKVMVDGKKSIAQKHVYQTLEELKKQTKEDPLNVMRSAIDNAKPNMEVRSRRVGGAAYQVPSPVRGERKQSLAIRWIIDAARKRPNSQYHHFWQKLAAELMDAYQNQGGAVDKKNQAHKMADANKAFAHFRW
jgi:small subunit ribosomal protein S7